MDWNGEYIYQQPGWPEFIWNSKVIADQMPKLRFKQGFLYGQMTALGFSMQKNSTWRVLVDEVTGSSAIEGIVLDTDKVRSSVARRLGLDFSDLLLPADHYTEGAVQVVLDATQNYTQLLTEERLFGWQAALFPGGLSDLQRIEVGKWRSDTHGPMQVVSGYVGKERVHYQAPPASDLPREMERFLAWFNAPATCDEMVKAAVAHLWFVMIHPFDDGNGRIARAICDMLLARSEGTSLRYYSLSKQIFRDRLSYYKILESSGRGSLDITPYLLWFLSCLDKALDAAAAVLSEVELSFNERQRKNIGKMLEDFKGAMTVKKWGLLAKCSHDTAKRDIDDLVTKKVLEIEDPSKERNVHYIINQHHFLE